MHIDTAWKFRAMPWFRDEFVRDEPGINLMVPVNEEGRAAGINPFERGSHKYTGIMKTQGLRRALDTTGSMPLMAAHARMRKNPGPRNESILSGPYEAPEIPDLGLATHELPVSESVNRILGLLVPRIA